MPLTTGLSARIEDVFARGANDLPADIRCLLLFAVPEPLGDLVLLWRAAWQLGIGAEAAGPPSGPGSVEISSAYVTPQCVQLSTGGLALQPAGHDIPKSSTALRQTRSLLAPANRALSAR